jgi:hypothetical protein
MCKKSTARMPLACWLRNCDHVGPTRRGAGPIPAEYRIRHTVDEARSDVRANQLTLGTPMAPARVLPGHPHHQLSDRRCGRRAPRPTPRDVIPLAGHEFCDATPATSPTSPRTPAPSIDAEAAATARPTTTGRCSFGEQYPPCDAAQRLMAQHQQFHVLGRLPSEDHDDRAKQPPNHHVDDRQNTRRVISTPGPGLRNSPGQHPEFRT